MPRHHRPDHGRLTTFRPTSRIQLQYLLGVSTRRVEKLAESLGVTQLSKSQVSEMAKHLDERVAEFRNRPLDQGPYTFVWVDALTQKVREGGRVVNVHCLVAVGVNNEGQREVLGLDPDDVGATPNLLVQTLLRIVRPDRLPDRSGEIFPDRSSIIRLIGAVLAEQSDEWAEQRRYIGSEILGRCRLHPIEGETPDETIPTALTA